MCIYEDRAIYLVALPHIVTPFRSGVPSSSLALELSRALLTFQALCRALCQVLCPVLELNREFGSLRSLPLYAVLSRSLSLSIYIFMFLKAGLQKA